MIIGMKQLIHGGRLGNYWTGDNILINRVGPYNYTLTCNNGETCFQAAKFQKKADRKEILRVGRTSPGGADAANKKARQDFRDDRQHPKYFFFMFAIDFRDRCLLN